MNTMTAPTFFNSCEAKAERSPARQPNNHAEKRDGLAFVRRVMEGWPAEVERFFNEYRPAVLNYLTRLSWDARSREQAMSAVDDVFSECFGGFGRCDDSNQQKRRAPLLQRYKGSGSLEGWLKRTARNRFYSALRRSEYRQRATGVEPDAEWLSEASTQPAHGGGDLVAELSSPSPRQLVTEEEAERLRQAVQSAFESLAAKDGLALIFLRLHFLEKIKKQRIAEAWEQHPATVGRRINAGLHHLRVEISRLLPDYAANPSSKATEALILVCRDLLDSQLD